MRRPPDATRAPRRRRALPLLALGALTGCAPDEAPPRLLAVVVDLSGPGAAEGAQIRDGARLALREATRAGAAAPELTLLVQDDRGDATRAARLAGHLGEIPEVLAVVVSGSGSVARASLPAYGDAGLPVLVAGSCSPVLTQGRPSVFCLAPGPEYLGETLAWFLVTELGLDAAAVFFSADPPGQAFDRGFGTELRRLGGEIVQQVPFDSSVTSFDIYLPVAREAPAVFVGAPPPETERATAALRAGGVAGPILVGAAGDAAPPDAGALYRPTLFDPLRYAPGRDFAARFSRAFGRAPTAAAALAYDAAALVARATEAGSVERPSLAAWLREVGARAPHEGVSGTFFFSRSREAVREIAVGAPGAPAVARRAFPSAAPPPR